MSREINFACAYINNVLETYYCCQVTNTITIIIPLRIIYVIASWTMVNINNSSGLHRQWVGVKLKIVSLLAFSCEHVNLDVKFYTCASICEALLVYRNGLDREIQSSIDRSKISTLNPEGQGLNRRRANREVQTVNWEGGGEGAAERGVKSSLKRRINRELEAKRRTNCELGRG